MIELSARTAPLRGEISVPGDKSISHRAVMLASIADGRTEISGFAPGADCLSTADCFLKLGAQIQFRPGEDLVTVTGKGLRGLRSLSQPAHLFTGNSGTTMRIIAGILAAQSFDTILKGDASLSRRPMQRIIQPLTMMGASIRSVEGNGCAPLWIRGRSLRGISYSSPVASGQVKSSVLCAGLYAEGVTEVIEPSLSRDHTERMLRAFGARVDSFEEPDGFHARLAGCDRLTARKIRVPGDISSAAYWIAAASIVPGSEILIRKVGMNPSRAGMIDAALSMGADITILNFADDEEPSADILVRYAPLRAASIGGSMIPALIDELPVIAVMAAAASGTTFIRDAAELRVKETDRILAVAQNLEAMGVRVQPHEDGLVIEGNAGRPLRGAWIRTYGDHRIAMAFSAASLIAQGSTLIDDEHCIGVSYPSFFRDLSSL